MISEPRPPIIVIDELGKHPVLPPGEQKRRRRRSLVIGIILMVLVIGGWQVLQPPETLEEGIVVRFSDHVPLETMLLELKAAGVIRNTLLTRVLIMIYGNERKIPGGEYYFPERTWLPGVAKQLARGEHNIPSLRVTFPEGLTNREMGKVLEEIFPQFDTKTFIAGAEPHEGYLFPNTYEFFATVRPEKVIETLRKEFDVQIASVRDEIDASNRTLSDIVIMASILEGEVSDPKDRTIISGILWKRIVGGMPLQVDAAFVYLLGKGSRDLTTDDLYVDSPYNTYRNKGLPPGAINNPGIDAIKAALSPEPSSYWYYLSDTDGVMHYAKTFEEHKMNKSTYLR